ncbi:glutathione S-transferase [Parathielavia appendiculata]|uniref:glutathione transferase n=1 Tax=Parathielavia appendiculata TaxID=2587402 RepID=A0AAN6TW77_9PEZI|nr:glutathione S-transferase [Parathielavia appendiculata]
MKADLNPPKPIRGWLTRDCSAAPRPNPWKVVFAREELGLNYEVKSFRFDDVKNKLFTDINPNGRVPAIEDPNTGLTLWESGAIYQYIVDVYQYIVDVYDTDKRLTHAALNDRHLCNQWLHFQTSGQGPHFGQAGWFRHLHPIQVPPAIERYAKEVRRVLASWTAWLIGGKMTFADMAFVPWNFRLSEVLMQSWDEVWAGLPHVRAWHERMRRAVLMDEQGLQWNGVPKEIETFTEYEEKIARGEKTTAE